MNFLRNSAPPYQPRLSAWALAAILYFMASPIFAQVPVIKSAQEASAILGNAFTYRIQASNKPTRFTATGLPAGLTLNSTTGLIHGTPKKSGTFRVTVTVRNARGVSKSVVIIIKVRSARPVITSALKASGTVGVAFSYRIQASNQPTVFGASGLPAGLKVNSNNGIIQGTPKSVGNFSINISAKNSKGTGSATLVLSIKAARVPAPVITSAMSANGTVGSAFSYLITASNNATTFGATGLPPGFTVNATTGLISGVPNAAGNSSVTISAANSGGTGHATLLLSVATKAADPAPSPAMITVQGGTLPQSSELAGQQVATFEIGKFEVTWGKWKEVRDWAVENGYTDLAEVGGTYPYVSEDTFPVINVNWYDVVKWCNAKSEMEGLMPAYQVSGTIYKTGATSPTVSASANGYRLPSDKEWEWAARGGVSSGNYTYSGSNNVNSVAWWYENSSGGTKAVGTKSANELGIYDMSGNVREWCDDIAYSSSIRRLRGGDWSSEDGANGAAVAARGSGIPVYRANYIGFRLARSLETMITVQGGTLPQSSELAGQQVATFQIGKYEVTWDEWQAVRTWAVANGYTDLANVGAGAAGNHPVRNVSWYDVVKWCNARSETEGLVPVYELSGAVYKTGESVPTVNSSANGYRLPLEKEWEWAARGGISSQGYTYSGSNEIREVGWSDLDYPIETQSVGLKDGNELDLYDMSGNVAEWCFDEVGNSRAVRGGGWVGHYFIFCVVSYRDFRGYPSHRNSYFGFRLARSMGN